MVAVPRTQQTGYQTGPWRFTCNSYWVAQGSAEENCVVYNRAVLQALCWLAGIGCCLCWGSGGEASSSIRDGDDDLLRRQARYPISHKLLFIGCRAVG